MLRRDEIAAILKQAKRIDSKYELFGTEKHKYQLNPPISADFVRTIEEKYGFTLPDDYFRFITEIGDGVAEPDYGIEPFADLVQTGQNQDAEEYNEEYRNSLKNAFEPRHMLPDELENFAIATKAAYEQNPDKYFIYEKPDDALCIFDGFYVLGTQGCQWDYGLVVAGEMYGKVFVTDNTGAYCLAANSFEEFYQNWLDQISSIEKVKEKLKEQRKLFGRKWFRSKK